MLPIGPIYFQQNPNCDDAVFSSGLNCDDPGTSQIARNFIALDDGVANVTLMFSQNVVDKDIEIFEAYPPVNLALGVKECLARCGRGQNGSRAAENATKSS